MIRQPADRPAIAAAVGRIGKHPNMQNAIPVEEPS
jgi:hypothetical protein